MQLCVHLKIEENTKRLFRTKLGKAGSVLQTGAALSIVYGKRPNY